jgi:hypothetical protein
MLKKQHYDEISTPWPIIDGIEIVGISGGVIVFWRLSAHNSTRFHPCAHPSTKR